MPVPASPCCRSLLDEPRRPGTSSSTASSWFRFRCCHGGSGWPAPSTAWPPSRVERSSSGSRCDCTGPACSIGGLLTACSDSRSSTCSCCSRRFWPTAAARRPRSSSRGLPSSSAQWGLEMRYLMLAVALLGAATLGGCTGGILDPKGPIAVAERQILFNSLGIMLAIVIPTILATLGVAYWFRASNTRARYMPEFTYSGRLEILVWSIPAMTVLLVGGVAWVGSHDLDPRKPLASSVKPVSVQVVSLDWKWLFIYPDLGIASVNQLTIPVGTPVRFELTSSSVMNSFFVPQLGGQIYTMAGMVTRVHLQADHPGKYPGLSANYSGGGFADMRFNVEAVPAENFANWVDATRGAGPELDAQAYANLAKPSKALAPFTYRAVAPGLFNGILSAGMRPDDSPSITHPMSQRAER